MGAHVHLKQNFKLLDVCFFLFVGKKAKKIFFEVIIILPIVSCLDTVTLET